MYSLGLYLLVFMLFFKCILAQKSKKKLLGLDPKIPWNSTFFDEVAKTPSDYLRIQYTNHIEEVKVWKVFTPFL